MSISTLSPTAAPVYVPGDAFTVGLVRDSWQRPGVNRSIRFSYPGQLWERVAENDPIRRLAGLTARARRGTPAYAGEGFGYHRDSHGVIVAGVDRFPLRVR